MRQRASCLHSSHPGAGNLCACICLIAHVCCAYILYVERRRDAETHEGISHAGCGCQAIPGLTLHATLERHAHILLCRYAALLSTSEALQSRLASLLPRTGSGGGGDKAAGPVASAPPRVGLFASPGKYVVSSTAYHDRHPKPGCATRVSTALTRSRSSWSMLAYTLSAHKHAGRWHASASHRTCIAPDSVLCCRLRVRGGVMGYMAGRRNRGASGYITPTQRAGLLHAGRRPSSRECTSAIRKACMRVFQPVQAVPTICLLACLHSGLAPWRPATSSRLHG